MQIFDLFGLIRLEGLSDLTRQMNQVSSRVEAMGSKFSSVGSSITGFGARLTAGVTAPIAGLAYQGLKFNSSMEDLKTSFEVMLGSAENAGKMVEKLKKMGAATPFETEQLAEYTKTMLSFGYTQKNVLPIMSRLGDVSLGNNEKMSSLTRTMGQINSLGKLQGGDLNQLIGQGWNPLNEIMKKTGETTEEVRKRMSKGKVTYKEVEDALVATTSKGGTFFQGMIKGSQTLSGKLSTLSDNFKEMLGNATKPLFDFIAQKAVPFLSMLIQGFNGLSPVIKTAAVIFAVVAAAIGPLVMVAGLLVTAIGGAISGFGAIMGVLTGIGAPILIAIGVIGTLGGAFVALMLSSQKVRNGISNAFETIKNKVVSVATVIKNNLNNIKDLFSEVVEGFKSGNFSGIAQPIERMQGGNGKTNQENYASAMANKQAGGTGQATTTAEIGNLIAKLEEARKKIVDMRNAFMDIGNTINTYVKPIMDTFSNTFKSMDFTSFKASIDNLKGSFSSIEPILRVVGGAIAALIGFLLGLQLSISNGILKSLPNVGATLNNVGAVIMDIIKLITDLVTANDDIGNTFKKTWMDIDATIRSALGIVIDFVTGFKDTIVEVFTGLYNILVGNSIVPDMVNGIINWFAKLPGRVLAKLNSLKNSVVSAFSNLASSAKNKVSQLVSGVITKFGSLASQAKSKVENMKSSVINAFGNLKSSMIKVGSDIINGLINGISSKAGSLINKAKSVASSVSGAFNKVLEIFSPSRVMTKIGVNVIKGLVIGLNHGSLPNTLSIVSKSVITAFFSTTNKVKEYFNSLRQAVTQSLNDIKSQAVTDADSMAGAVGEALKRKHEKEFEAKKKADLKMWMLRLRNAKTSQDFEKAQSEIAKINSREYVAMTEDKLNKEIMSIMKNKAKMKSLLAKYYPDWQNAGQSIGDILINGLNSKKTKMGTAIDSFFKKLTEAAKISVGKVTTELNKLETKYGKIINNLGKSASKIESLKNKISKGVDLKKPEKPRRPSGKLSKKESAQYEKALNEYDRKMKEYNQSKKNVGANKGKMEKEVKSLEQKLKKEAAKYGLTYKDGHLYFPNGVEAFEKGVRNFGGGLAIVGERGPELVNLPTGADVYSNRDTSKLLKGNINITNNVKHEKFIMNGNVTIDSKNIKDINDVISVFKKMKTESRLR